MGVLMRLFLASLVMLAACATVDPFQDVAAAQQRLDERGIGFGVTRVPGHDAYVLQLRFAVSETGGELLTDPLAASRAAAPEGCRVETMMPQGDGAYRVDYACAN